MGQCGGPACLAGGGAAWRRFVYFLLPPAAACCGCNHAAGYEAAAGCPQMAAATRLFERCGARAIRAVRSWRCGNARCRVPMPAGLKKRAAAEESPKCSLAGAGSSKLTGVAGRQRRRRLKLRPRCRGSVKPQQPKASAPVASFQTSARQTGAARTQHLRLLSRAATSRRSQWRWQARQGGPRPSHARDARYGAPRPEHAAACVADHRRTAGWPARSESPEAGARSPEITGARLPEITSAYAVG